MKCDKPFYGHMYAHRGLHNMNPTLHRLKNLGQNLGQNINIPHEQQNTFTIIYIFRQKERPFRKFFGF